MIDPTLPVQVAPPVFAVSGLLPHAITGAEVVALPVLPGTEDGDQPLLGPGADQLADALGVDLLGALEVDRATGKTGEIVQIPAPLGIPSNPQLRLVLLVGVGDQRPTDFRRAGAALARAVRDRATLATSIPALAPRPASRRSSSARCSVRSASTGAPPSPSIGRSRGSCSPSWAGTTARC